MGLQPLDLQVMYQQSANIAKLASGAQAAQLAESINQQTNVVQKNLEESRRVQQTNDENSKVGDRNSNGQGYGSFQGKDKNQSQESSDSDTSNEGHSSEKRYLGTIIDIVG